jgi:dihydroorotate dehydrogenase electron transfer subunit
MIQTQAQVLSYKKIGEEYHLLTIVAPEIAEHAKPGQFVNVRAGRNAQFILRRPFSIYKVNRRGAWAATIEILFDIRGGGTAELAALRAHDVIDMIGPLGRPFAIPKTRHSCLMVGGGIGAVPLFFLAEKLKGAGKRVDVLWGASTVGRLLNSIDAKRLGAVSAFATDDGSEGHHGRVTDLLPEMINRCGTEVIYACGPHAMMKAVAEIGKRYRIPVQVALEAYMGCGIGICMTCIQPVFTREGDEIVNVRTCVEGPVFSGSRVAWDAFAHKTGDVAAPPGN